MMSLSTIDNRLKNKNFQGIEHTQSHRGLQNIRANNFQGNLITAETNRGLTRSLLMKSRKELIVFDILYPNVLHPKQSNRITLIMLIKI